MSVFRFPVLMAASVLCCVVVCLSGVQAQDDRTADFDIASQPIAKALITYARQAKLSIALPQALSYRDGKTRRLRGRYSHTDALERMLRGTGFSFELVNNRSVRVFRAPPQVVEATAPVDVAPELPHIEEILVTSLLRPDVPHKLPYSISTLQLSDSFGIGTNETFNIARKVASLNALQQGNGQTKLLIRGLSDGAFAGRSQALVGTYLDGSQISQNGPEPNLRLVDIDRLEILRGPQGTLYGSGALSGLYRVVTNKPDTSDFGLSATASLAVTKSGDPSQATSSTVNIPVIANRFALRAVAYYENNGGFIDELGTSEDGSDARSNVNSSEVWGGRVSAGLELDEWSFTLSGALQNIETSDSSYFVPSLGRNARVNSFPEPNDDLFRQLNANLDVDLGWADFTTDVSFIRRSFNEVADATSVELEFIDETEPNLQLERFDSDRELETISVESHLKSKPGERLEWILGAYYAFRREDLQYQLSAANNVISYDESLDEEQMEYALFGEATYFLNEKLAVTLGARGFTYDTSAVDTASGVLLLEEATLEGAQKQTGLTPKAVISYHPDDTTLVYAQYSQGYRLGGINIEGPNALLPGSPDATDTILENFASDQLDSFELGYKHQSFDRRFAINAAAFYADWSNIQAREFDDIGLPIVGNVGDARIYGAELDVLFRPWQNVELKGNVAYNKSDIVRSTMALGAQRGNNLPAAPRFSAGASVNIDASITDNILANVVVDYSYLDGSRLFFDQQASQAIEAHHFVNMQASVYWEKFRFTLFVTNLFDSRDNIFGFGNPFVSPIIPFEQDETISVSPRPRSIGIDIGYRF